MKRLLHFLVPVFVLVISSLSGFSQTTGIYLTFEDFSNEFISHEFSCNEKGSRISLGNLKRDWIKVKSPKGKFRYKKSETYGYLDCNGQQFRFFENQLYQISEVGHLIVYQLGDSDTSLGEELNSFATFHFSLNLSGPILPLNLDNLKQAYPENHQFHDLLDANFSGGQAIFSFDEFHNTYKVNRILGECSNH
ncbi:MULTISPECIES: hypothetical protein [Saprospirales]|jgi:hypothetical protein|uniref:hypothetical protein n=1 Tax=Saprospirales TaxID=1936988 RepID=UPI0003621DFC|nr:MULTISPECIES: hypothetical protein [Saprospirales]MCI5091143.1 hypothetical protein [Phaeodactylibacter sp.]